MDYRNALEKAILYIENHLYEDIRVEDAAKEAGYSYYHFTRQFSAVLGESVGSYIKKRRLADASKQLLYTEKSILDIALSHGFESGEAFSRAFKAAYKSSPALYRKKRLELFITHKPRLDEQWFKHLLTHITVHPRIVTLPDINVAGLRGFTTLSDNLLPDLWTHFNSELPKIPHKKQEARFFGICEASGDGNTLYNMNKEALFSEVAGVEVTSFFELPSQFAAKTLKSGRYAVFTHTGSLSKLSQSFSYIWGTWFLVTDEELDDGEDFELYDERFLGYHHPSTQIDLYIPLKLKV